MSLKAKVEAVVYAAEEPVTLAQLAGIFAQEVLEGLAAAAAEERQAAEDLRSAEGQALEEAALSEPTQVLDPGLWPPAPADAEMASQPQIATANEGGSESLNGTDAPAAAAEEGNEKKAARLRDRQVRQALARVMDELIAEYADGDRGLEIREIAGGYRMATKPEYHDSVRGFVKSLKPPMKLSLQALETLAVIAYKQPVTAPEVSEIRGVDSGGVLGSLIGRKLITTAGRKQVIGRPILYKTTKEFLLRFGLKDLNELPSMEEFEKMAGELAEAEAEVQDAAMHSPDELPIANGQSGTVFANEAAAQAEAGEASDHYPEPMEESGGESLQASSADADVRPEISGEPQHEAELAGETSERVQESEPTGMSEPDTGSRDEAQKAHGVDEHE